MVLAAIIHLRLLVRVKDCGFSLRRQGTIRIIGSVYGTVVSNMFPDWDLIMKRSRLSLPKQTYESMNAQGALLNEPIPPTSAKHSGSQGIPEMPGNSNNLPAAQNDIGSHEYMETETRVAHQLNVVHLVCSVETQREYPLPVIHCDTCPK